MRGDDSCAKEMWRCRQVGECKVEDSKALEVRVKGEEMNMNQTSWVPALLNSEPNQGRRDYTGKPGSMGF